MKGRLPLKPGQSAKCIEALKALHGPAHTPESLVEKEQAIARELARNQAEKRPSPQLELDA